MALFTEIANESWVLGAYWVISLYCVLALILGISPLAPGSVADTLGGFLLAQIYMHESRGYNFFEALLIAMAYVTVLHFVGSCLQYFIGKAKSLKAWANFSLPADILAASDSVFLDASCVTVGIVGQVFMDTFSGFNQGRMGMDFCTQFWSEYASLPTGYSWVAFGAVLSVQGVKGYEWATHVLPICLLMAFTWQFLGTTLGAYKILKANETPLFWKNKEKWETVQYFYKKGVRATKEGWANDCFCLQEKGVKLNVGCVGKSLFRKIQPTQKVYAEQILSTESTVKERKITEKKFMLTRSSLRKQHWDKLVRFYFESVSHHDTLQIKEQRNKDYFVISKPLLDLTDLNNWRKGGCQWFLVLAAIALSLYSYLAIGRMVETEEAVQEGMNVLKDVSFFQWLAFAVYNVVVLVYYHKSVINSMKSGYKYILSVLFCTWCRTSDKRNLETTFKINIKELKSESL